MSVSATNTVSETDFRRQQYTLAVETFRTQLELLVQILTAFVIANVTVIGFAVAGQQAGVLLAGALVPIMMWFVVYGMESFILPIIYTAYTIEVELSPSSETNLVNTFVSIFASAKSLTDLKQAVKDEQASKLRHSGFFYRQRSFRLVSRRRFRYLLVVLCAGQIASAFFLWHFFGWQLF